MALFLSQIVIQKIKSPPTRVDGGVGQGGVERLEDESRGSRCRKGESTAFSNLLAEWSFSICLLLFEQWNLVLGGGSLEMLDIYRNVNFKNVAVRVSLNRMKDI